MNVCGCGPIKPYSQTHELHPQTVKSLATPDLIPTPAGSPRNLLEMQTLRPQSRPIEFWKNPQMISHAHSNFSSIDSEIYPSRDEAKFSDRYYYQRPVFSCRTPQEWRKQMWDFKEIIHLLRTYYVQGAFKYVSSSKKKKLFILFPPVFTEEQIETCPGSLMSERAEN